MPSRGFTLAEVLVVSVVAAVLAALAWPAYRSHMQRAARSEGIQALQKLQLAQERHREMFGTYAATLAPLGVAPATTGGRYQLVLARTDLESYQARAEAAAGGSQHDDRACPALTLEVRQGFATAGPDGRCWNR
jgi:type IV pilus assembly protein PilE